MSFSPVGKDAGAVLVTAAGASLVAVAAVWPFHALQLFHAGTAAGVLAAITIRFGLRGPAQAPPRLDVGLFVGAIVAQAVAMPVILPRLHGDLRQIWLAVLTIAALHFIPMGRPFGRWIVVLGGVGLGITALGYFAPTIPIQAVIAAFGLVEISAGAAAAARNWPQPRLATANI